MYNLLISRETALILTQYAIYGSIFIIGLVILFIIKRKAKKPVSALAVLKTEALIKRVDKLFQGDTKKEKNNDYIFPAKIIQLSSEVGDLVVLADKEFTENRNITYESILGYYQSAAARLNDINMTWDMQIALQALTEVKSDLQEALDVLKKLTKTGKG